MSVLKVVEGGNKVDEFVDVCVIFDITVSLVAAAIAVVVMVCVAVVATNAKVEDEAVASGSLSHLLVRELKKPKTMERNPPIVVIALVNSVFGVVVVLVSIVVVVVTVTASATVVIVEEREAFAREDEAGVLVKAKVVLVTASDIICLVVFSETDGVSVYNTTGPYPPAVANVNVASDGALHSKDLAMS